MNYVGSTTDIARRLREHFAGNVLATRQRRPLRLIYTESIQDIVTARHREQYLKSAAGRRFLKKKFQDFNIGA